MTRKTTDATPVQPAPATTATTPGEDAYGEEKTQPVHKIRIRNVTGAIWQNARQDGTTYYTFTASRSYRDEQGNWHSTSSFGAPDGFILAEVARQCALHIVGLTQGDTPF